MHKTPFVRKCATLASQVWDEHGISSRCSPMTLAGFIVRCFGPQVEQELRTAFATRQSQETLDLLPSVSFDDTILLDSTTEWYHALVSIAFAAADNTTLFGLAPDAKLVRILERKFETDDWPSYESVRQAKHARLRDLSKRPRLQSNLVTLEAWPVLSAVRSVARCLVDTTTFHVLLQRAGFKDTTRLRPHQHEAVVAATIAMLVQDVQGPLMRQFMDHDQLQYTVLGGLFAEGTTDFGCWPQSVRQVALHSSHNTKKLRAGMWRGRGPFPAEPMDTWQPAIDLAASDAKDEAALDRFVLHQLRLLCLAQDGKAGFAIFDTMGLGKTLEMVAIGLLSRQIYREPQWAALLCTSRARAGVCAPLVFMAQNLLPFKNELEEHTTIDPKTYDTFVAENTKAQREQFKRICTLKAKAQIQVVRQFSDRWVAATGRLCAAFPADTTLKFLRKQNLTLPVLRQYMTRAAELATTLGWTDPGGVEFGADPPCAALQHMFATQKEFELAEPRAYSRSVLLTKPSVLKGQEERQDARGIRALFTPGEVEFVATSNALEWEPTRRGLVSVLASALTPRPISFHRVFLDEAHMYRTQTRGLFGLVWSMHQYGTLVVATGTPLCNRSTDGANLFALLRYTCLATAMYRTPELSNADRLRLAVFWTASMRARTDEILDLPLRHSRNESLPLTLLELSVYLSNTTGMQSATSPARKRGREASAPTSTKRQRKVTGSTPSSKTARSTTTTMKRMALTKVLRLRQSLVHRVLAVNMAAAYTEAQCIVSSLAASSLPDKARRAVQAFERHTTRGVTPTMRKYYENESKRMGLPTSVPHQTSCAHVKRVLASVSLATASVAKSGGKKRVLPAWAVKTTAVLPLDGMGIVSRSSHALEGDTDVPDQVLARSVPSDVMSEYCSHLSNVMAALVKQAKSAKPMVPPVPPVPVPGTRAQTFQAALGLPLHQPPTPFEKGLLSMFSPLSLYSLSSKEARVMSLLLERHPHKEEKMVVFTSFAAEAIHMVLVLTLFGIKTAHITGGMNSTNRKAAKTAFQKDPATRVIVCTLASGSHAITLTAGRLMVMLDPWWAKYVDLQARKRIHRIGQTRQCLVYGLRAHIPDAVCTGLQHAMGRMLPISTKTLDDDIYAMQLTKEEEAKRVLGHDLRSLNVQVGSSNLQKDQANALVKSVVEDSRLLCTKECIGVQANLGQDALMAAVLCATRRGMHGL